ncbi:MAG: 2Fe-2S iron-sulfur cluster-binding protein [Chloroflexota bacterium]
MKTISLTIDGKHIMAPEGATLLDVALENGIYIPNLCHIRGVTPPPAACRLCFVEIEGYDRPVTACTEAVKEGMVVNTKGTAALRLARTGFELLMATHPVDCAHCPINRRCELQKIAAHLRVRLNSRRFRRLEHTLAVDESTSNLRYDPNKCVLCGRCIWVCRQRGAGILGFARRGFERKVTTFANTTLAESGCTRCEECVQVCPAGAFVSTDGQNPKQESH